MDELKALQALDTTIARAVIGVYIRNGRESAIDWLSGFWYGSGIRFHEQTLCVATVLGVTIQQLSDRSR